MQQSESTQSKWAVLAVILLGVFMAMVDSSIVNVALPVLERSLSTSYLNVQWVVLSYMLAVTCLILLAGRLADMFSKRRLYAAGFAIFTLGSLLCGLAGDLTALVLARVTQGLGAALIMALGPAVLVEHFPPNQRGRAIGLVGSMVSLGIVVGPTLGGVILTSIGWRWIFFVNLPLGVVGTLLVLRLLQNAAPKQVESFDFAGASTLSGGLLCVLLALTLGQKGTFGPHGALWLGTAGAISLLTFVRIEFNSKAPVLDLRIFRSATFSISMAASFLSFVSVAGVMILMPFYLQTIQGYDARTAGFLLAAMPVALGLTAPLAGLLSDRYGCQIVSAIGLCVTLVGFGLIADLAVESTSQDYILRFLPVGVGLGLFQSPNNSAVLSAAPRDRVGIASGVLSVARTLGQTLGIALTSAYWSWRLVAKGAAGSAVAPNVQMSAMRETFVVTFLITCSSLALVLLALWRERQGRAMALSPQ